MFSLCVLITLKDSQDEVGGKEGLGSQLCPKLVGTCCSKEPIRENTLMYLALEGRTAERNGVQICFWSKLLCASVPSFIKLQYHQKCGETIPSVRCLTPTKDTNTYSVSWEELGWICTWASHLTTAPE